MNKALFGVVPMLASLAMLATLGIEQTKSGPVGVVILSGALCVLMSLLFWKFGLMILYQSVTATSDGLTYQAPGCKTVTVLWSEIESIEGVGEGNDWSIKGKDGAIIIGASYGNWPRLAQLVNENVQPRFRQRVKS